MSNIVKNQHIIPKFLIKYWGDLREEFKLEKFDKFDQKYTTFKPTYPKTTAKEEFYFDGPKEFQINEQTLGRIENDASTIIEKIISKKSLKIITTNEKLILSNFIFLLWARSSSTRDGIAYDYFHVQRGLEREDISEEQIRDVHTRWMFHMAHFDQVIRIFNLKWILIENISSSGFILSDNPILINNPFEDGLNPIESEYLYNFHDKDFTSFGIEIQFPIHPKFMIFIYHPFGDDQKKTIPDMERKKMKKQQVITTNTFLLKNSYQNSYFRIQDKADIVEMEKCHYNIPNNPDVKMIQIRNPYNPNPQKEMIFHNWEKNFYYQKALKEFQDGISRKFILFSTRFIFYLKKGNLYLSLLYRKRSIKRVRIDIQNPRNIELISDASEWVMSLCKAELDECYKDVFTISETYSDKIFFSQDEYCKFTFKIHLIEQILSEREALIQANLDKNLAYIISKKQKIL